jgi:hypothetical protein
MMAISSWICWSSILLLRWPRLEFPTVELQAALKPSTGRCYYSSGSARKVSENIAGFFVGGPELVFEGARAFGSYRAARSSGGGYPAIA